LKSAQDEGITVQAVGAPRYRLIVKSTDYLKAEKQLKEAAQKCIEIVEKEGGEGEFLRELT
ncbi:MAG TPA: translation initiation factor IF-2 subunit alpha, partial [Methanothermobacter thermautotrophicus]|nr:translation initiation factor IF-2 subunit alpha [Methanothermobacter thermautotrophicus]